MQDSETLRGDTVETPEDPGRQQPSGSATPRTCLAAGGFFAGWPYAISWADPG